MQSVCAQTHAKFIASIKQAWYFLSSISSCGSYFRKQGEGGLSVSKFSFPALPFLYEAHDKTIVLCCSDLVPNEALAERDNASLGCISIHSQWRGREKCGQTWAELVTSLRFAQTRRGGTVTRDKLQMRLFFIFDTAHDDKLSSTHNSL